MDKRGNFYCDEGEISDGDDDISAVDMTSNNTTHKAKSSHHGASDK